MEHIGAIARRLVEQARDQREALDRKIRQDDVPGVQPRATEEGRPLPERVGD